VNGQCVCLVNSLPSIPLDSHLFIAKTSLTTCALLLLNNIELLDLNDGVLQYVLGIFTACIFFMCVVCTGHFYCLWLSHFNGKWLWNFPFFFTTIFVQPSASMTRHFFSLVGRSPWRARTFFFLPGMLRFNTFYGNYSLCANAFNHDFISVYYHNWWWIYLAS
jgi:hypothetical protein